MQGIRAAMRALFPSLAAVLALSMLSTEASAREVAPRPVEPGQWYFGATAGYEEFPGPRFKSLKIYKDDSASRGDGFYTVDNPQGFLINKRLGSRDFVPNVHFGYGLPSESDDFLIRVEVNLEGWNRNEDAEWDAVETPELGAFQDGGIDVVGIAQFVPIDGKDNDDDEASFGFSDTQIEDVSIDLEEFARGGDISLFFDDRTGRLVYSRGVSVVYQYLRQDIDYQYTLPAVVGLIGIDDIDDALFDYEYRVKSHLVGSRLHYSVGYEFLSTLTVFTTGSVGLFARYSTLKGKQNAPCLTTCLIDNVTPANTDFTRGERKVSFDDWKFAYDARMGLGVSIDLFLVRLTAHGGGTRIGRWISPRETAEEVDLSKDDGWGYFANATATLKF